jgi:hypothetical protein
MTTPTVIGTPPGPRATPTRRPIFLPTDVPDEF